MARPQFTIRGMASAIGMIGLLLAILIQATAGPIQFSLPLALVVFTYCWFAKVSYRVRLPMEIALMLGLLGLSTFVWRDRGYLYLADEADQVAQRALSLSEDDGRPGERARYRRVAAYYSRRATVLRR